MKTVKKAVIWTAVILVLLIPTYLLVFGAVKTAAPVVSCEGGEVEPVYLRWVLTDRDGGQTDTGYNERKVERKAERDEMYPLSSLASLTTLSFGRAPESATIFVYDMSGAGKTYSPVSLSSFDPSVYEVTGETQVGLTVAWSLSSHVTLQAVYGFSYMG